MRVNRTLCSTGLPVELSRETSPAEDGVPAAEEAMEATEANAGEGDEGEEVQGADPSQPGIYTEHVFTDPLGMEPTDTSVDTHRWKIIIITGKTIRCFCKI